MLQFDFFGYNVSPVSAVVINSCNNYLACSRLKVRYQIFFNSCINRDNNEWNNT